MPLTTSSAIFSQVGELGFLAELARAAYHLRVDNNPGDGIDSNEWPSLLFGVDAAVDPSFAIAGSYLQLMNPADFGAAGTQLELNAGFFYTDGLQNGLFTTANAAALVGRSQDALFISFRGTNDNLDLAQDVSGLFNLHWSEFAALRSAVSSFIDNPTNGISHVYVTGHSLGAAMVGAMMMEHAGDARFEAVTFASPGYMFGSDQTDARITNVANSGDVVSFVETLFRIDGDINVLTDGFASGLTEHSLNLYYAEAQFLRANGIDIAEIQGAAGGGDFDSFVFAAHDNGDNTYTIGLGADELTGTAAADLILGGDSADRMFGGAGLDRLLGGEGNDTLVGNTDVFVPESDILDGGNGSDTLYGEVTDIIIGGAGFDVLYAVNDFSWSIDFGATGIEYMRAGFGNDTLNGMTQAANLEIYGGGGNDVVTGGAGSDFLWGESGDDTLVGGGGADVLVGAAGGDSLSGGDGNDTVYIDGVDIFFDGGAGIDALYITAGSGRSFDLVLTHFEWIADFTGADDIFDGSGTSVAATVYAGGGGNLIKGGGGGDFLWGEAGNDTITGNAGNDTLVGGSGADVLTGGSGIDTIFANSGGGGDNAIDRVLFDVAGWGTDFVYDFEVGRDKLDLHGSGATAGTISITTDGLHAQVHFGADLIVVVGAGGTLGVGDFVF